MTSTPSYPAPYSISQLIHDLENKQPNSRRQPAPQRNVAPANIFPIIAGPCSVESEEQIVSIAQSVRNAGAVMLRGGAYKPRTSPHSFRGLGEDGLKMLKTAREATGLPVVTEVLSVKYLDTVLKYADVLQIGARNSQNFTLLEEVGKTRMPVLFKRGFAMTYQEVVNAVEYIEMGGNNRVIICERGMRTFEPGVRNTLDIAAVPILKGMTHHPVIVDPSHSVTAKHVPTMALASVAAGADGLLIEVHNNPQIALSDGDQAITTTEFAMLSAKVQQLHQSVISL